MAPNNRAARGRTRRIEQGAGQVLVGGLHTVAALLAAGRVRQLWVAAERRDRRLQDLLEQATRLGLGAERVAERELAERLPTVRLQGVLAACEPAPTLGEGNLDELLAGLDRSDRVPLLLVLDGVQDPHNLGACLRSADGAGADAVIVPRRRAAGLNATVRKVASGAAETVPLIQVTNLARSLAQLADHWGVHRVGAADQAERSLYQTDLSGPLALVLGAEGQGLRRMTREHCDSLASIPMLGGVGSLNVSVAAGVCLYEALRQRRPA